MSVTSRGYVQVRGLVNEQMSDVYVKIQAHCFIHDVTAEPADGSIPEALG